MSHFIIEEDGNDVIVRPKLNEGEKCEVGDSVTFPVGQGGYSSGTVVEVRPYFDDVIIQPLAMDLDKVTIPTRYVVVQRKGVASALGDMSVITNHNKSEQSEVEVRGEGKSGEDGAIFV